MIARQHWRWTTDRGIEALPLLVTWMTRPPDPRAPFMFYTIGGQGRLLEIQITDGMTKEKILSLWDAIEAHPLYDEATAALVLLKPVIKWNVSNADMTDLAKKNSRFKPLHWAIVAFDELSFGMSRMFCTQVEDESLYGVFKNEATAQEWLRDNHVDR